MGSGRIELTAVNVLACNLPGFIFLGWNLYLPPTKEKTILYSTFSAQGTVATREPALPQPVAPGTPHSHHLPISQAGGPAGDP